MRYIAISVFLAILCFASAQEKPRPVVAKTKEQITKLALRQEAAKKTFIKAPKNAAARAKYVDLTLQLAYDSMKLPEYAPREKYPKALRLYREVLKTDPKNREAATWKKTIEDIYKSMGRPIPPEN